MGRRINAIELTCAVNKRLKLLVPMDNIDYISYNEFGVYVCVLPHSKLKKPQFYVMESWDEIKGIINGND